ncbi:MAG: nucleotidyltransferase family protein [Aquificaceae bacterium]
MTKNKRSIEDIKEILSTHLEEIREKHGVKEIGILEFYRGEKEEDSYVEIVVDFERPAGFFKFFKLEDFLKELLGIKVELTTRNVLKQDELKRVINL